MPEQWLARFLMLIENNIEANWKKKLVAKCKSLRSYPETMLTFNPPLHKDNENGDMTMSSFLEQVRLLRQQLELQHHPIRLIVDYFTEAFIESNRYLMFDNG